MSQNRFIIFFKFLNLGSLFNSCPGSFSNAKLYKVRCRTSKIEPSLQSVFEGFLSTPVMLKALLLQELPGII